VSQHPLTCEPQRDNEVEVMSDSMDDDFVVVYNTAGLAAQASGDRRSGSNSSSSKASSGLVDPKAAAVLAGAAPVSRPWPGVTDQQQQQQLYQQQHQQQPYSQQGQPIGSSIAVGARPWAIGGMAQQQHCQAEAAGRTMAGNLPAAGFGYDTGAGAEQTHWLGGAAAAALPVATGSLHAAALQAPNAAQRVQLLVQVVRGCACLLAQQEPGAGDAAQQPHPHMQQGEQLALLLLALQLVQALCLPHGEEADSKHYTSAEGPGDADVSLSDMLAAASQADLEQLMGGAVELLRLAKASAGLTSSTTAAGDDGCWGVSGLDPHPTGHSQFAGDGGAVGSIGCGLSRMTGSLLALPLPDPFSVLYRQALDSCRAAAVEEVMGNWQSSMGGYSLAADLLLFLSYEWPQLGQANPGLQEEEREGLHKLYSAVNARLAAVVAEAPSAVVC
jgi:hypothetical protein